MKPRIPLLACILGSGVFSLPATLTAQDSAATVRALRLVAGAVAGEAAFQYLNTADGKRYPSVGDVPTGVRPALVSPYNDWRYWNGVICIGMLRAGSTLHDSALTGFAVRDIAFCFDSFPYFRQAYAGEGKWNYPFGQLFTMEELDDCGAMGASLIEVNRIDPQERYSAYLREAARFVTERQVRLSDGTFARNFPKKGTVWADDLYMSIAFLSRMGESSGNAGYFEDAARQVVSFHKYLFDDSKGLMRHNWYSEGNRQGVAFWGRANGWALLAQVDLLDRLPRDFPGRPGLIELLKKQIAGVARYQSPGGLWHQLIDRPDSYLETSCSAMFTYAIARAVNRGYVGSELAAVARRGWNGILTRIGPDGKLAGVCAGTGISDDLEFYYQRPTPPNDPHGIGAVLLAGCEVLALPR